MNALSASASPREMLELVWRYKWLWIAPTLLGGGLAAVAALIMPRVWQATMPMAVRQEASASRTSQPGKFSDLYEMRTLQETILEIARSRQVVEATLQSVDAADQGGAARPIDPETLEKFRGRLDMLPPGGAEFGKTEVFYFSVKDPSRARALALVAALGRELDLRLREVLAERAEGLIVELQQQVNTAEAELSEQTLRLKELEAQIGPDLGELRMLHSGSSGQSDLRQQAVSLENDARRFQIELSDALRLQELLKQVQQDPAGLAAAPNALLAAHPALMQLKEGLIAAQLNTSRLRGSRGDQHPRVLAAAESENRIRRNLHHELATALQATAAEVRLGQERHDEAQALLDQINQRLERLAVHRAEYSNRVAAVDVCRQSADAARQKLVGALAAQAAANSAALLMAIDQPETGPYPIGPGRTVIAAAGACGGLLLGLGLVMLQISPTAGPSSATPADAPRAGGLARTPETAAWDELRGAHAAARSRENAPRGARRVAPAAPRSEWWESLAPAAPPTPADACTSALAASLPRSSAVADFSGYSLQQAQRLAEQHG